MEIPKLLEIRGVSKAFPGVQALNNITLDFAAGEVHVLVGENGAGKSTLIKIISGVYTRDTGTITFNGQPVHFTHPRQAIDAGISVLHQELSLIPDLTVAENIFLGREPRRGRNHFLDKKQANTLAAQILGELEVAIDPKSLIRNLSIAQKQMVELSRAISRQTVLVIMDEPTSSLSEREVHSLFRIIKKLKQENVGIIYVSHRLHEIPEIGDRVTVLRDGKLISTLPVAEVTEDRLISLMVGREITTYFYRSQKNIGDVILEVQNLSRSPFYRNISFQLRQGEILGIAGLVGAGRTELLRGIFGVDRFASGQILLNQQAQRFGSPKEAIQHHIGLVPEERRLQGLLLEKSVKENISLPSIYATSKRGFIDKTWETNIASEFVKRLSIRTPSIQTVTKNLSGGNQQKVVIAKWLTANSHILLLDEPTRGIDVNAKAEIYALMNEFTEGGGSIIMVSSELPEILGIADRILVMREGTLMGMLNRDEATEETIMALASIRNNGRKGGQ